jgi:hypothetical protein
MSCSRTFQAIHQNDCQFTCCLHKSGLETWLHCSSSSLCFYRKRKGCCHILAVAIFSIVVVSLTSRSSGYRGPQHGVAWHKMVENCVRCSGVDYQLSCSVDAPVRDEIDSLSQRCSLYTQNAICKSLPHVPVPEPGFDVEIFSRTLTRSLHSWAPCKLLCESLVLSVSWALDCHCRELREPGAAGPVNSKLTPNQCNVAIWIHNCKHF